ncbi:MAG: hypothetical protein K6A43_11900, partial [Treponema sp.]|nr:hypothetical protein [Treponema sp.]
MAESEDFAKELPDTFFNAPLRACVDGSSFFYSFRNVADYIFSYLNFIQFIIFHPNLALPKWVYPTLKMTKRIKLVVIIFSVGRAFRRSTTRQGQSPTPLRGVSSPLEKFRNIAPSVMKASPTRTKWLSDKVVAYASVFFSLSRPTFRRWIATKLAWIPFPIYLQKCNVMCYNLLIVFNYVKMGRILWLNTRYTIVHTILI